MEPKAVLKKGRRIFRKYRRLLLLLAILAGAVLAIFYLKAFFTVGVDWNGAFLVKGRDKSAVVYEGHDAWSDIAITINRLSKNEMDVSFRYMTNKTRYYKLSIGDEVDYWQKLTIAAQDGSVLFAGKYQKGNSFLYNLAGLPAQGEAETTAPTVNPYLDFQPNFRRMTGIVLGEYDHIHGDIWQLLVGLLLLAVVIFDAKSPFVSARLREFLLGDAPAHAGVFELVQGCVRGVVVLVALGFLLAAV